MLKLRKYIKPFLPVVALALSLLFVQALCELRLPDLMSDIVNVGLQLSGIEDAAPEAITPDGLALITAYMDDTDEAYALSLYVLYGRGDKNPSGMAYDDIYPAMGDSVYIRVDATDELNDVFSRASYNVINALESLSALFGSTSVDDGNANQLNIEFDMDFLYQAHELIQTNGLANVETTLIVLNETYLRQVGAMFARAYYQELGINVDSIQTRYILRIGIYMLFVALMGGVAAVLVGYFAPRVAAGAARDLRRDLFAKVEDFSQNEFDTFSAASLITRCTNDVSQVQMLVGMGIRMMCFAPIMGIGGIIMALQKSVSMSWIIALAVIVLLGIATIIIVVALPKFKAIQKFIDTLNRVVREILSGLMVIRAFGAREHERKRFDAANMDLLTTNLFVNRAMAIAFPAITFIMNGTMLLIVWVGAGKIADSSLQIGDMMAFMQYSMHIIFSFMMITMMFVFIPRAAVSVERIAEVLEVGLSVKDPEAPLPFQPGKKGVVEFRDVSFRYNNAEEDAVQNISFTAKPGEVTAIIGATGSGKSTIANLLLRFYDVTSGEVYVNGVDIRLARQSDLRKKIGYIPQKTALFTGTIGSNIGYGVKDAGEDELITAATVAQAMDIVAEKPEGFEAEISQKGANISGGQKQRLSIARAIITKPEIFIFDDSFSALDFKTDAALRKALKEHTAEATVIIVAQRVGTIMGANQIIVMEEGKIAGIGTHSQLLETCPEYYEIASTQFTEEQLNEGKGGFSK